MRLAIIAAVLAATLAAFGASAHDYSVGSLQIADPWARATPAGATTGGAYMTIANSGDGADRLVGGSAEIAESVEIHHMSVEDGVMRMRQLPDGLEIAPGAEVTLAPGGYHIMLLGLTAPLIEGERVPMTLDFAEAGAVEVELTVEAMGASAPGHGDGHGHSGASHQH